MSTRPATGAARAAARARGARRRAGAAAAALVALLALASWHLVEKPFLAARSHYRRAEASALRRAAGT